MAENPDVIFDEASLEAIVDAVGRHCDGFTLDGANE